MGKKAPDLGKNSSICNLNAAFPFVVVIFLMICGRENHELGFICFKTNLRSYKRDWIKAACKTSKSHCDVGFFYQQAVVNFFCCPDPQLNHFGPQFSCDDAVLFSKTRLDWR